MRTFTKHMIKPAFVIILIFCSGCATREDFQRSFIARHVEDGVYTDQIKGFELKWPESDGWIFRDYAEFDLSFDHTDGRSQVLIIGVNQLVRRDFPDGFHHWIMDRLRAIDIENVSHTTLNNNYDIEMFRIVTRSAFAIERGQALRVYRKTDTLLMKKNKKWVAVIAICPVEYYDEKIQEFEVFFDNLKML
jgi:hypothetical protein